MRKIVVILSVLLLLSGISRAQNTEIFEKKGKYGLREGKKTLVKPKYADLQYVGDGLYAVKVNELYGLMNKSGVIVVPPEYNELRYMTDNTYQARIGENWGLINRMNQVILPIEYSGFVPVDDYRCEVRQRGNLGYMTKFGDMLIPPLYENINEFDQYSYLVKQNGKYGIIDKQGRVLVPSEYDSFEKMPALDLYNIKCGNKIGIMNASYQVLIPAKYDSISDCVVGKNLLLNNKIGFYMKNGNKIVEPSYSAILFYQPEFMLAVVKEGEKYGFVTGYGVVVEPAYENISRFSPNGIAFVEKSGKLMAVNIEGRELTVQETMQGGPTPPPPGSR